MSVSFLSDTSSQTTFRDDSLSAFIMQDANGLAMAAAIGLKL